MELLQKWEKKYSELNEEYLRTKGMMTEREITECLLHLKSISAFIKDIQALHQPLVSVSLLERAASLVGNPGTNISGSTDMACDEWQKDYERWCNER